MSAFLGLRTCAYYVPDLAKAKVWYSEVFQTKPYFDEAFYIGFNIGGYELGLLPQEKKEGPKTTNVRTYWGVRDIQKEYTRLLDMGARPLEPPTNVGDELMVAAVLDPWDNAVGLIYNPYFKLPDE